MTPDPRSSLRDPLVMDTAAHLALGAALVGFVLWPAGPAATAGGVGASAVAAALVLFGIGGHRPHRRFGLANRITWLRLCLTIVLAALAPSAAVDPWFFPAVAALAVGLDAGDGWAARRQGTASRFGARFDMETDAFLVLALGLVLVVRGHVGAWILAAGLLRYLFIGLGWVWPVLGAELPVRWRRKAACAVGLLGLVAALVPASPWPPALPAGLALAVLGGSFLADWLWLLGRGTRLAGSER